MEVQYALAFAQEELLVSGEKQGIGVLTVGCSFSSGSSLGRVCRLIGFLVDSFRVRMYEHSGEGVHLGSWTFSGHITMEGTVARAGRGGSWGVICMAEQRSGSLKPRETRGSTRCTEAWVQGAVAANGGMMGAFLRARKRVGSCTASTYMDTILEGTMALTMLGACNKRWKVGFMACIAIWHIFGMGSVARGSQAWRDVVVYMKRLKGNDGQTYRNKCRRVARRMRRKVLRLWGKLKRKACRGGGAGYREE